MNFSLFYQAVKKSREKAKLKTEATKKQLQKLREDIKVLEGQISEQKKTKKLLINLATSKSSSHVPQDQFNLFEASSDDE